MCFSSKSFGSLSGLAVPMIRWELSQVIRSTRILILPPRFAWFFRSLAPDFARRDIDQEPGDLHEAYVHRLQEESGQSRVKGEVLEGDEGLSRSGGNHIVRADRCAGDRRKLPGRAERRRRCHPIRRGR